MASSSLSYQQQQDLDRLLALANVQRLRSQFVDAEDTCRKALEIAPEDVQIREMLADILQERGMIDDALKEYKAAMELAPGKASLETKYAKLIIEIAERERDRAIAQDMINNPRKYTTRKRNAGLAMLCSAIVPGLGQFYNGEMIKAGVIFGVFLLFVGIWASLQTGYNNIGSMQDLISTTSPIVLILGFIAGFVYIYGIFDAAIMAGKSSGANKTNIKH
ncbi:MAG: DUF5683 domain-containing protein [Armatimonadota bacterium]